MEQHTGGDAVSDVLKQAGVTVVFGIPSVHNLPIYDSIRRRGRSGRSRSATSRRPLVLPMHTPGSPADRASSSPRRGRAPPTPWGACWRRTSPAPLSFT